jgi:hypothetical protein
VVLADESHLRQYLSDSGCHAVSAHRGCVSGGRRVLVVMIDSNAPRDEAERLRYELTTAAIR